jgi:type IV pilus assembly protein PilA
MFNRQTRWRGYRVIEAAGVITVLLIILAFAVPQFRTEWMFARRTAAIKAIQAISAAEAQYRAWYGRYAKSLRELGPPAGSAAGPAAADLIDSNLASGEKDGYRFSLTVKDGHYTVTAKPVTDGNSGE